MSTILPVILLIVAAVGLGGITLIFRKKQLHIWILSYIKSLIRKAPGIESSRPIHILFCLADHFEPYWNAADEETARRRVALWADNYPKLASRFLDADGKNPQHTFFYPSEEYRPEHLEKLALLCKKGFGEVEVHLHHDRDTSEGFRNNISAFIQELRTRHGLLPSRRGDGSIRYAFIHGNWALDNSRKDGRWCGVNNELQILRETGCYADLTLPSAPSDTQTAKINSIYYATDDPSRPKSHNTGHDVRVGGKDVGDLLMIQGPLTLNWRRRSSGIFPRIENGEIAWDNPPTAERVDMWVKQHIHVKGRPDWVFIKVHTHGAQEKNQIVLLGEHIEDMHRHLNDRYNDRKRYFLHYVTAREMYNIIKAAEAGKEGTPGEYRDYLLTLP